MKYKKRYLPLTLLLTFVILFFLIKIQFSYNIDEKLTLFIYNHFNNQLITNIFLFITNYGTGTFFGGTIVSIFILFRKNITTSIYFIISSLSLFVSVEILKLLILRSRPFVNELGVTYLSTTVPIEYSFPSGHTSLAFFIAYFVTNVLKLNKSLSLIVYLFSFMVAFSRVYLGAHYLFDVLGGIVWGTLIGIIAVRIYFTNIEDKIDISSIIKKRFSNK